MCGRQDSQHDCLCLLILYFNPSKESSLINQHTPPNTLYAAIKAVFISMKYQVTQAAQRWKLMVLVPFSDGY